MGAEMSIGGDDLLTQIENESPKLGQYLRAHLVPAIETLATNTGASATGFVPAPDPPEGVTVNPVSPEHIEVTIQHSAPVNKGIEYFTEVATNSAFTNPRVEHHGATRSPVNPIYLPTNDSTGTAHNYYLRSYAQQPGSPPSTPHVYAGNPVTMTGTTNADHTASTGSGTAAANGSQGGSGWGKVLQRPAVAPKRSV
jgi:hypothetical protein